MSKVGKQPINVPEGVTLEDKGHNFVITGPKGELTVPKMQYVEVGQGEEGIVVKLKKNMKQGRSNWGTERSLLANAVKGVTEGFTKELEINGVGYRAEVSGGDLVLSVGFSHPVKFAIPQGIEIKVEKNNIKISGHNKELVGQVAANIRKVRKPEPYKGKGIKYKDEVIIRKSGKKVVG